MEVLSEKPEVKRKPKVKALRHRTPIGDLFKPHEPIPRRYYLVAVILSLVLIFGTWGFLSYGGHVKPSYFLPTPTEVLTTGWGMMRTGELFQNAWASIVVIVGTGTDV